MYKSTQNFDSLIENQTYSLQELLAIYHESIIITLQNANVLVLEETTVTTKDNKKETQVTE